MKQFYNKKTKSWVKGKMVEEEDGGKRFQISNVKEQNPQKPFKGVKKMGKKRK